MRTRRSLYRALWLEELESRLVPSTVTSSNWSGYAAETSFTSPQSAAVSAVSGSWTVPKVLNTRGTAFAAFWLGIDGFSSNSVEQIGTDSDIVNGVPQYYAWYEMYPNPVHRIGSVRPNDVITASVTADASNNFTLTIADASSTSWANPFTITLAAASAQRASAEWIAEAPLGSFGRVLPLANFGTVHFTNAQATINGTTGPIDSSSWQNTSITMVSGSTTKATPSGLTDTTTSPVTSSFSVTWNSSGSGGGGGGKHGPNDGAPANPVAVENSADPSGPSPDSVLSPVAFAALADQAPGGNAAADAPLPRGNRFDPGASLAAPLRTSELGAVPENQSAAVTDVLFADGFDREVAPLDPLELDALLGELAVLHVGAGGDSAA
jgi:hypothetical protein